MIIIRCASCALELHATGPMSPPVLIHPGTLGCQHDLRHTHDQAGPLGEVRVYFSRNGRDWTLLNSSPALPRDTAPAPELLAPWARYLETIL